MEDIVEVTETLMEADHVSAEAFASPTMKPEMAKHLPKVKGKREKLKSAMALHFSNKMNEQKGHGVFKRGSC